MGLFDVTPVAESAGEVDVTDKLFVDALLALVRPVIAARTPISPGLGLLTSNGERFAFRQFDRTRNKKTIIKTTWFFIFGILFLEEIFFHF